MQQVQNHYINYMNNTSNINSTSKYFKQILKSNTSICFNLLKQRKQSHQYINTLQ